MVGHQDEWSGEIDSFDPAENRFDSDDPEARSDHRFGDEKKDFRETENPGDSQKGDAQQQRHQPGPGECENRSENAHGTEVIVFFCRFVKERLTIARFLV
jgi:hypothetical protein